MQIKPQSDVLILNRHAEYVSAQHARSFCPEELNCPEYVVLDILWIQ